LDFEQDETTETTKAIAVLMEDNKADELNFTLEKIEELTRVPLKPIEGIMETIKQDVACSFGLSFGTEAVKKAALELKNAEEAKNAADNVTGESTETAEAFYQTWKTIEARQQQLKYLDDNLNQKKRTLSQLSSSVEKHRKKVNEVRKSINLMEKKHRAVTEISRNIDGKIRILNDQCEQATQFSVALRKVDSIVCNGIDKSYSGMLSCAATQESAAITSSASKLTHLGEIVTLQLGWEKKVNEYNKIAHRYHESLNSSLGNAVKMCALLSTLYSIHRCGATIMDIANGLDSTWNTSMEKAESRKVHTDLNLHLKSTDIKFVFEQSDCIKFPLAKDMIALFVLQDSVIESNPPSGDTKNDFVVLATIDGETALFSMRTGRVMEFTTNMRSYLEGGSYVPQLHETFIKEMVCGLKLNAQELPNHHWVKPNQQLHILVTTNAESSTVTGENA